MLLGLIGTGTWGKTYARTLRGMGIDFLQVGREWHGLPQLVSGVIVASAAESHFEIAANLIERAMPCLIEKPICLASSQADELLRIAGPESIVFAGHTRLYSNAWREFKSSALSEGVKSVQAVFGGPCKLDPLWDRGSHMVAMCLDLGFDPLEASIVATKQTAPLQFCVNGTMTYVDQHEIPSPLELLITEFCEAIDKAEHNVDGLKLGAKVVEALEKMEALRVRQVA